MDLLTTLALWAHFVALGFGGAATFGIPVIGRLAPSAPPEARPVLAATTDILSAIGRKAVGLLILSGLFLLWAKHDAAALPATFWIKIALVAGLVLLVVASVRNGRRARAGDAAAQARAPLLGRAGMGLFMAIVLAAVLTFS